MTNITNEIAALRKRLEELEKIEAEPKIPPIKILEDFITQKNAKIQRNSYSKSAPLARFYDMEKVEYLQAIFDMFNDVHKRLDALESKQNR